ncbi:hypothetical protein BU26DRAFT_513451 [Trematosphaeria pertusa]|uniref:Mitochondrial export translocase Oxa2 n=1 Tax=Trematosphaeria pertusa TaxID=390896 RepID=A0A6A6J2N2_9PLEO|nr:uncharacterized protein BU26DRAFT_513451 [Trematosphaeria pertusa]KAF2256651.1 hypothetical protein BU26DRAFT_513451 [Trematosphaeria pertusa]
MLSARLLRQPARQLLSRNTITPSTSFIYPRARAFHATAPRNDAVLGALLYLPHEMTSLLHSQLPWYATIPLMAFITRGLLVTTAGSWARALTARYIGLHPLRQAIGHQKRDQLMQNKSQFKNPIEAKRRISKEVKAATGELDKRWNCTLRGQVHWTFAQIPIFLTMAEIIRQMCNARDGLLGMGLSAVGLKDVPEAAAAMEAVGPTNPWFEPSLANEGMLWFPDLLAADPTGVLPFVVSGLMFSNVYFTKNTGSAHPDQMSTVSKSIRRTLLGVSLLIGPLCQGLPAALLLYWASSTTSVILWNFWLDWKYPAPRGFTECKRPLQMVPSPKPKARRI